MTGYKVLTHGGTVSHENALDKVHAEYQHYKVQIKNELSCAERIFVKSLDKTHEQLRKK